MPKYDAKMKVVYEETWSVDAANEEDARKAFDALADEVDTDDMGEVVDWEVRSVNESRR